MVVCNFSRVIPEFSTHQVIFRDACVCATEAAVIENWERPREVDPLNRGCRVKGSRCRERRQALEWVVDVTDGSRAGAAGAVGSHAAALRVASGLCGGADVIQVVGVSGAVTASACVGDFNGVPLGQLALYIEGRLQKLGRPVVGVVE